MMARASFPAIVLLRMALFATLFMGPVGAFAALHAKSGPGGPGVGLVLLVSLQRAG